jgi:ABC-type branched-subunit amino acid transport system substrate-binding protein
MTKPLRVGILNDMSNGPPAVGDMEQWLRRITDELIANGRIDRPVEFINAWGLGLPAGTAAAIEHAYAELAAQNVLLIVGPAIGDNALLATPLAERHRISTLNWAGAERARGEYMFHLQVGSHEDESIVIAHHLASLGARDLGVIYDRSPIGDRHLEFLQSEAQILGLRIAASNGVSPLAQNTDDAVDKVLVAEPDAFVYLGLGLSAPAVARAVKALGFTGPCVMNTAGLRGYTPDYARNIDGWWYVDMHSETNTTLTALRQRLNVPTQRALAAAKGYDMGRLVAESLARAPEYTCEGIKIGLELVKWLPAAEGYEGTLLGFGKYDRGALHGRYLVMRQWRDGKSFEATINVR